MNNLYMYILSYDNKMSNFPVLMYMCPRLCYLKARVFYPEIDNTRFDTSRFDTLHYHYYGSALFRETISNSQRYRGFLPNFPLKSFPFSSKSLKLSPLLIVGRA